MADFTLEFELLDEKQKDNYVNLSQQIIAVEAELVKISEERAIAEAGWRKRENFLQTEMGKLQIAVRMIRSAVIKEAIV